MDTKSQALTLVGQKGCDWSKVEQYLQSKGISIAHTFHVEDLPQDLCTQNLLHIKFPLETQISHLQSEEEIEKVLSNALRQDNKVRSCAQKAANYLCCHVSQIPNRLKEIQSHSKQRATEPPRPDELSSESLIEQTDCPRSSATLSFYKQRQYLNDFAEFLSPKAIQALKPKKELVPSATRQHIELAPNHTSVIFCDLLPEDSCLEEFLGPTQPGTTPNCCVIIFSHWDTLIPILENPYFYPSLQNRRLKLWHKSEALDLLQSEVLQIRATLTGCKQIFCREQADYTALAHTLQACANKVTAFTDQKFQDCISYYRSPQFLERIQAIKSGQILPKVLVNQACHTVAVKQFSRTMAKTFRELGCEVYTHPVCGADNTDYLCSTSVEIAHEKPDLFIQSPNCYPRMGPPIEFPGLPTLYSLQDLQPHENFPNYIQKRPMGEHDCVLFMQERFLKPAIQSGASEKQIFFDFLPSEVPDGMDLSEKHTQSDIGLIKTMPKNWGLLDRTLAKNKNLSQNEQNDIRTIENILHEKITQLQPLPFAYIQKMVRHHLSLDDLLAYCHEQMCKLCVTSLSRDHFNLHLHGSNWHQDPQLKAHAQGHANNRQDYFRALMSSKIQLSINPWNEYHPRIFDGALCACFFLIYKVPEETRWQKLPSCLKPGEHYEYFSSLEELKEKGRFYTKHPEKRDKIAKKLQHTIQTKFGPKKLAERILDKVYSRL